MVVLLLVFMNPFGDMHKNENGEYIFADNITINNVSGSRSYNRRSKGKAPA